MLRTSAPCSGATRSSRPSAPQDLVHRRTDAVLAGALLPHGRSKHLCRRCPVRVHHSALDRTGDAQPLDPTGPSTGREGLPLLRRRPFARHPIKVSVTTGPLYRSGYAIDSRPARSWRGHREEMAAICFPRASGAWLVVAGSSESREEEAVRLHDDGFGGAPALPGASWSAALRPTARVRYLRQRRLSNRRTACTNAPRPATVRAAPSGASLHHPELEQVDVAVETRRHVQAAVAAAVLNHLLSAYEARAVLPRSGGLKAAPPRAW